MTEKAFKHVMTGPVVGDVDPTFLDDLPKDNLVAGILALSGEVYILRDRLRALERQLARNGTVSAESLEDQTLTDDEREADQSDLEAFVNRVMSELTRQPKPVSTVKPAAKDYFDQPE